MSPLLLALILASGSAGAIGPDSARVLPPIAASPLPPPADAPRITLFGLQDPPPSRTAPAPPSGGAAAAEAAGDGEDRYYENLYRRFSLSGGFAGYANFDTALRLNSEGLFGAIIDLEDELDVDEQSTIGRFDGQYAFSRAHRLDFSYYDIRRDGTSTLLEDSQIGDILFPAGTEVTTRLDTLIFKVAYRYNFVADEKTTIGASFGIHWMSIDFDIDGPVASQTEEFDVDAPLPLLGLHWSYAFTRKWKLLAGSEVLRFDVGQYRGVVSDTRITIEHDTFEHFGWGIGYNGFAIDAHFEDEDDLDADLEYGYQGLMLYLRTYF